MCYWKFQKGSVSSQNSRHHPDASVPAQRAPCCASLLLRLALEPGNRWAPREGMTAPRWTPSTWLMEAWLLPAQRSPRVLQPSRRCRRGLHCGPTVGAAACPAPRSRVSSTTRCSQSRCGNYGWGQVGSGNIGGSLVRYINA